MPKRSPDEILRGLDDSEVDDDLERALAMGGAERRRELEAAGVDLRHLDARAAEVHERARGAGGDDPSSPTASASARAARPRRFPRHRWPVLVGAGLALAGLAPLAMTYREPVATPNRGAEDAAAAPALRTARRLRQAALDACDRGEWKACLDGLDAARGSDPEGDLEAPVRAARRRATEALPSHDGKPPRPE